MGIEESLHLTSWPEFCAGEENNSPAVVGDGVPATGRIGPT